MVEILLRFAIGSQSEIQAYSASSVAELLVTTIGQTIG